MMKNEWLKFALKNQQMFFENKDKDIYCMINIDVRDINNISLHLWRLLDNKVMKIFHLSKKYQNENNFIFSGVCVFSFNKNTRKNDSGFWADTVEYMGHGRESVLRDFCDVSIKNNDIISIEINSIGESINFTRINYEDNIHARVVGDIGDYLSWANERNSGFKKVSFRGVANSKYGLSSSLQRRGRSRIERFYPIFTSYLSSLEASTNTPIHDDLNFAVYKRALGLARHHMLPTPSLDWTRSEYIALFFAFSDAIPQLYSDIINAIKDKNNSIKIEDLLSKTVRIYALTDKFIDKVSSGNIHFPNYRPYISYLKDNSGLNSRLRAQQGEFLLTNIMDVDRYINNHSDYGSYCIDACDIEMRHCVKIMRTLNKMGLNMEALKGGLDAACEAHTLDLVLDNLECIFKELEKD